MGDRSALGLYSASGGGVLCCASWASGRARRSAYVQCGLPPSPWTAPLAVSLLSQCIHVRGAELRAVDHRLLADLAEVRWQRPAADTPASCTTICVAAGCVAHTPLNGALSWWSPALGHIGHRALHALTRLTHCCSGWWGWWGLWACACAPALRAWVVLARWLLSPLVRLRGTACASGALCLCPRPCPSTPTASQLRATGRSRV